MVPVPRVVSVAASRAVAVVRAARPRQWAKNLLVALPAAGTGTLFESVSLLRLLVLASCFSLVASGVYLFNDVCDADADRLDPRKAARPVASGELAPGSALRAAVLFLCSGIAVSSSLGAAASFVLGLYVLTSSLYSWRLKHVPLLEVVLVASGFVFRAAAGALVLGAPLGGWFLPLVGSVAVFVTLVKRSGEIEEGRSRRRVLGSYGARGLRRARLVSLAVVLVLYAGWVAGASRAPASASFVFLVAALFRVNSSVSSGGAAPDELVFRDRVLLVLSVAWFGFFLLAAG